MNSPIVEIDFTDWQQAHPRPEWTAAVEAGQVLFFPKLGFELQPDEKALLREDMLAAGKKARRETLESYNAAVGSRMGHAIASTNPRKRRKRRDHLEIERERARADQAEAKLAAAEAEIVALRARVASLLDQGHALAARARVWIGALRGDPAAVRDAGEAPTITEGRIDATLGVSAADIQRRRMVAI